MKKVIVAVIWVIVLGITVNYSIKANAQMGHGMMGYGYGGGFIWLIVLVLVGVGIYFLLQVSKSKGSDVPNIETPLDILKKRYANGEIDKEEFERKKKDLE